MKKVIVALVMGLMSILAWKAYPFLPSADHFSSALNTRPTANTFKQNQKINLIRVYKSKRYLELLDSETVVRRYPIRLGSNPVGHKTTENDGKTPEGRYHIDWHNAHSAFYKSLHISYPNAQDTQHAKQRGVSAGGDVMIHGSAKFWGKANQPLYHYLPHQDWTLGCIAVSNAVMDEIWLLIKNGTPIEILP